MPRYLIERTFGHVSLEEVTAGAPTLRQVTAEQFPQLSWVHSHGVMSDAGLKSFCIYDSPDEQTLRDHARVASLPIDRIYRIEVTDGPDGMIVHTEAAAQG